jgi:hypothetical protein
MKTGFSKWNKAAELSGGLLKHVGDMKSLHNEAVQLEQQLEHFEWEINHDAILMEINILPILSFLLVNSGRAKSGFNLVYKVVCLILTLSVATVTAERVFGMLKILKTRLCMTVGGQYLSDAMMPYVEKEMADLVSAESIMKHFMEMVTRQTQIS